MEKEEKGELSPAQPAEYVWGSRGYFDEVETAPQSRDS